MRYRRGAIISLLLLGTCSEEMRPGETPGLETSHLALGVVPGSEVAVWQRVGGSSNPDGRYLQAAAFDEDRKVFVMFGGAVAESMRGQAQPSQETWEWNPVDGRWSNRTGTGTAPSSRSGAAMVYLPEQKRFLLFGGRAGSGFNYEDTWSWDPATGTWTDLTNSGDHPSVRGQHAMVYEKSTKKALLFGGARGSSSYYTGAEASVSLGDTWEWDPATGVWSPRSVTNGPSPRHDFGMVWDSGRNRVVLFGGMSMDIAGATGAVKQDVWDWDPQVGTWTEQTPSGNKPRPRYGHAAAFDASRGKTLVFGGTDLDTGALLDEVWEWDGAVGTWSQRPTAGPSGRMYASMVYDDARLRLDLMAGMVSGTAPTGGTGGYTTVAGTSVGSNEVWELDPATASFTNRTSPADVPSPRTEHAMAYSPSTQTMFVFGGADMQGRRLSDLWEWNGSTWTAHAAVGPQARSGAGLAYDPRRKTLILVGGTDYSSKTTAYGDTWELDTATKKWTPLKTATLSNGIWGHGMVTDTTHGKILVFGGIINGRTSSNKVWEWDGDALTWTDRTPPASASSPGARNYPQLAYDEGRQKMFLFDGPAFSSGGSISAFWEWDPVSYGWELRDPKDQLTKSYFDFAAYDSIRRREVIFTNGYESSGQLQTLELDARKPVWYVRTVANSPSERRNAAMVFDSKRGVVVLFGGSRSDGTYLNEIWEYKVSGSGNGVGCTQAFASFCASGNCVEGVCCEAAACTGACKSCNVPELEGTCVLAKAGTEVAGSCSIGQACDGSGNCKTKNGQACSDASACATGLCVDGVCCDTACNGACVSCNNPGQAGKCSPYAAGTDPQSECGQGTGVCKSTCDGVGRCAYPKENLSCGACLTCDGAGTCSLPDRTCVGGSGGSVRGGSTGTSPMGGAGGAVPMGGSTGTGKGGAGGTLPSGGGGHIPNGGSGGSGGSGGTGKGGAGGAGGTGGTITGRGGSGGSGGTGGTITSSTTGGAVGTGGTGGAASRTGGTTGSTSGTGGKQDAGVVHGGSSGSPDTSGNTRLHSSGCACTLGHPGQSTLPAVPLFSAGLALLLRRRRRS